MEKHSGGCDRSVSKVIKASVDSLADVQHESKCTDTTACLACTMGPPISSYTVVQQVCVQWEAPSHHSLWCKELLLVIVFLCLHPWSIPFYNKTCSSWMSLFVDVLIAIPTSAIVSTCCSTQGIQARPDFLVCVHIIILLFQETDQHFDLVGAIIKEGIIKYVANLLSGKPCPQLYTN